jgi:succinoglycan biosynthesis transport protein ExoP
VGTESTEKFDIRAYLRPVRRWWWLILGVVSLVTAGTYIYYNHKPKYYGASTELFVQTSALNQLLVGSTGVASASTVQNLSLLIQTRAVGEQAAKILKHEHARGVVGGISAQPVEESNFITISGTGPTPQDAAVLANAYAKAFVTTQTRQLRSEANKTLHTAREQLAQLGNSFSAETQRQGLEEKIRTLQLIAAQPGSAGIRQVEPAVAVAAPLNHHPKSNAMFAFVISLMLAIAAAFGLEYLTRRITSVEAVEEIYELPILTEVPKVDAPAPFDESGISMAKALHEPFHRLQMNLEMLSHEKPLRTILVASAAPGEGKSIVTRNLALAYREAGRNVAVFDGDFRKATLGALLAAQEGPGFTDILAGRVSFGQAIQPVPVPVLANGNGNGASGENGAAHEPNPEWARRVGGLPSEKGDLAMVPAGLHTENIATALASGQLEETLKTASETYDTVIIDSSPLLAAADVLPLLSAADGVLLVSRLGVSTRDSAQRLLKELQRVSNINLVGVVVNGIPPRTYRTRAYGYYYG